MNGAVGDVAQEAIDVSHLLAQRGRRPGLAEEHRFDGDIRQDGIVLGVGVDVGQERPLLEGLYVRAGVHPATIGAA